jgi:hypothetical protein
MGHRAILLPSVFGKAVLYSKELQRSQSNTPEIFPMTHN